MIRRPEFIEALLMKKMFLTELLLMLLLVLVAYSIVKRLGEDRDLGLEAKLIMTV